ncbi:alpha/beta-hydrolase [Glonium stellatum]|uniref:Alpha/beta-hydrolase n=1 Tax=Glonium stellatum TaxID=574774 RepID=A0A8E2EZB8_9PEZI|nr:alpha/beta-hydrolase [Glonium stellatum]
MATLPDIATHINLPASRLSLCLSAGAASLSIFVLFKSISNALKSEYPKIILSPKDTALPNLSQEEIKSLPYPPDALPGARNVDSPYGSIRVYEWGPEDGRKVLFIHGISTPCIALAGMAHKLVDKGCRVMLFDLFGRGYSSAPSPTGPNAIQYDSRLYATQILLAITSSPLHWSSFSLIGYSLGGGLAADFTSYFPRLVSSLILLAPSGLLRPTHITRTSRLLYSPTTPLPTRLLTHLVAARLHTGPPTATSLAHHAGFVPAFISSLQHAPIHAQQTRWGVIGARLDAQKAAPGDADAAREGLEQGKVLLLLGARDAIVLAREVGADAVAVLGEGNVEVRVLEAGHEVPIERVEECVEAVWGFWGSEA